MSTPQGSPSEQDAGAAALMLSVQAQAAARAAITTQLVAQIRQLVVNFTGWYDDRQVHQLATHIARMVSPSQRLMASTTSAYLARVLTEMTGNPVRPVGAVNVSDLRKGVAPDDVYVRLANEYRYKMSLSDNGTIHDLDHGGMVAIPKPPEKILAEVLTRAEVMADTDVTRAMTEQVQSSLRSRHDVTGYRRVIHPEMSRGGSCGLCIAASDRIYHKADLMPVHGRCACTVLPVLDGRDPAGVLNDLDLRKLYKAAGNTTDQRALKKVRWTVGENGELGPILTRAGDNFRSPADVSA